MHTKAKIYFVPQDYAEVIKRSAENRELFKDVSRLQSILSSNEVDFYAALNQLFVKFGDSSWIYSELFSNSTDKVAKHYSDLTKCFITEVSDRDTQRFMKGLVNGYIDPSVAEMNIVHEDPTGIFISFIPTSAKPYEVFQTNLLTLFSTLVRNGHLKPYSREGQYFEIVRSIANRI